MLKASELSEIPIQKIVLISQFIKDATILFDKQKPELASVRQFEKEPILHLISNINSDLFT